MTHTRVFVDLHVEIKADRFERVAELLDISPDRLTSRFGFFQAPILVLEGEAYAQWFEAGGAELGWEAARIQDEIERLDDARKLGMNDIELATLRRVVASLQVILDETPSAFAIAHYT